MIYNLEYEIVHNIDLPDHIKKVGYSTSATVFLYETDKNDVRTSLIGIFNFKIKRKKDIQQEIINKIQRIVFLRHDTKNEIEKTFYKIVDKFND
jgi:hypothetical protein